MTACFSKEKGASKRDTLFEIQINLNGEID